MQAADAMNRKFPTGAATMNRKLANRTRKSCSQSSYSFEQLEARNLLAAVGYDSTSSVLNFSADIGTADVVDIRLVEPTIIAISSFDGSDSTDYSVATGSISA